MTSPVFERGHVFASLFCSVRSCKGILAFEKFEILAGRAEKDLRGAATYLSAQSSTKKLGAVGFCMAAADAWTRTLTFFREHLK